MAYVLGVDVGTTYTAAATFTGGAPTMSVEERLQPALQLKPEVASLNMGSMNFGLYEMLGRYKEFKYEGEKP